MLYKSWQIWMCGSLVCHHVYYVFYYCFVCCTYPSYFPFFFWNELSWKLIKNVYLNRGPNKLMLQCPSLLHQMYMLFINWMYFICDNKLCWTWKKKKKKKKKIPRMITAINLLLSFHHIVYMTKGVQSMISQANTSGRSTGLTGNWQVTEIPLPPIIFDTEDNEVELFV